MKQNSKLKPAAARLADLPGPVDLDGPGFLRLIVILKYVVPVSRSSWYVGVKAGRYPAPVKLGDGRSMGYRKRDVKRLVEKLSDGGNDE